MIVILVTQLEKIILEIAVDADPFLMDEPDPLKSRALESSLWELDLLKNHVQPKVAAAAKFLDTSMPSIEWDFREQLDSTYAQVC